MGSFSVCLVNYFSLCSLTCVVYFHLQAAEFAFEENDFSAFLGVHPLFKKQLLISADWKKLRVQKDKLRTLPTQAPALITLFRSFCISTFYAHTSIKLNQSKLPFLYANIGNSIWFSVKYVYVFFKHG